MPWVSSGCGRWSGGSIPGPQAVLHLAIGRDVLHRAGAVERHQGPRYPRCRWASSAAARPSCPSFPPGTPRRSGGGVEVVGRPCRPAGSWPMSKVGDAAAGQIRSIAFWITVRVFRPRKSNFTSPAASTHFMLNWVAGMSSADRGTAAPAGPAAGRRSPRRRHGSRRCGRGLRSSAAYVEQAADRPLPSRLAQRGSSASALVSVTGLARVRPGSSWTAGRPARRASAARGPRRDGGLRASSAPKVMICATRSRPYFCWT
jgi:hypothetical protein